MRICFGDKIHVITLAFTVSRLDEMLGSDNMQKILGFSLENTCKISGINPQDLINLLSPSINARVTR